MLIASMESKWVMAVLIGGNFSNAVASLVRLKQRDQEIAGTQGMFMRLGRGSLGEVFPEAYATDRRARPEASIAIPNARMMTNGRVFDFLSLIPKVIPR